MLGRRDEGILNIDQRMLYLFKIAHLQILIPLRKVISFRIYPPPTPPFAREGRGATIHKSKIYSILPEKRYSPPCGQGGAGGG